MNLKSLVASRLAGRPWAIAPARLEGLLANVAAFMAGTELPPWLQDIARPQGYSVTESGIAVVPVLGSLVARGKLTVEAKDQALARIRPATTLDGFGDRDLVIEAIVENVEIKAKLFRDLDAVCSGDAILATNTSSISITKVAAASKRPERVVGMHFFNPVPVMQLVEIIRALQTADDVVEKIE